MHVELFHADNGDFFDLHWLRRRAANIVAQSPLITGASRGDRRAATALKIGFWPFVSEFEHAIDRQSLPRQPLVDAFGAARVRRTFAAIARAVRDMKEEEGSHAAHWVKDARCLGVSLAADCRVPGVQRLIERSYTKNLPLFFATLAGTELIAEELSRLLVGSKRFTELFSRKRWLWGEVHVAPHQDGPSHLDIDLDLARAYGTGLAAGEIERMVAETGAIFAGAADQVADLLTPELLAA
jgi:hypothetical protein